MFKIDGDPVSVWLANGWCDPAEHPRDETLVHVLLQHGASKPICVPGFLRISLQRTGDWIGLDKCELEDHGWRVVAWKPLPAVTQTPMCYSASGMWQPLLTEATVE